MNSASDEEGRKGSTDTPRLRHFSQSLPMLLLRAREAVMRHFRASLRGFGLTEQQWRVLRALSAVEEVEVSELARVTYLLAPSLSRIIRDLDERRLIVRRSDAADHRRSLIRISPAGQAMIDEVSPQSEAIYADIARHFGQKKLEALQALLRELEASMLQGGATADDEPAPPALGRRRKRL